MGGVAFGREQVLRGALTPASAGSFPSPAQDDEADPIDLAALLVPRPEFRASGTSMTGAGVMDGSLLIVERTSRCPDGAVVLAEVGDGFVVKRLRLRGGRPRLESEAEGHAPILLTESDRVVGIVRHIVTEAKPR